MTHNEVLAMKPGRELDALVAEKVMGWVEFSPIDPTIDFGVHGKYRWNYAKDPKDGKQKPIPWYSEDIAAAWEVVEKMLERGGCEIGCYGSKNGAKWFEVNVITMNGEVTVTAQTPAEAICKAALLAVMEE